MPVQRYSSGAILLHWVLALALAIQTALGFAMPEGSRGFALYQLHKSLGITILLLTLVRIGWRLAHNRPKAVEGGLAGWLAGAVHLGFYIVMIAAPLTGWALVSTAPVEVPTLLFGTVPWPHLPLPPGINPLAEESHEILAWIGIGLFVLHVAGAARHHWLIRDGLVRRMAPGGSAAAAGILAALVIVAGGMTLLLAGEAAGPERRETVLAEVADPDILPEPEPAALPVEEGPIPEASASPPAAEPTPDETAAPEAAEPPTWTVQPGGRLAFSVGSETGAIKGSFGEWSARIRFDPERPEETARIRVTVNLASASVGDPTQDQMLAGDEFLASAARPTATYRTDSVKAAGGNRFEAQGTLDLRGVSKRQPLAFTLTGSGLKRHVEGSATIDRLAFGIGTGSAGSALDQTVSVTFSFDAVSHRP